MSDMKDIPEHALERMRGLRGAANPEGIFTSDFSVNEFLLVRKAGFEPVGLCVGSCIYHLGFQMAGWTKSQEMTVLSQAMYEARELAMSRMRTEAADMGADGVVGVRLTVKRMEWDTNVLEFVAIGTGIVHAKGHPGFKGPEGRAVYLRPVGPGFLDPAARRLSPTGTRHGQLRLPRRPSGHPERPVERRPECRTDQLLPGTLRRT